MRVHTMLRDKGNSKIERFYWIESPKLGTSNLFGRSSPCFGRYTQLNNFTLVVVVVWGCGVEFGYEGNEGLLLGCGFPFTFVTWEGELARLPWLGSILVCSILWVIV